MKIIRWLWRKALGAGPEPAKHFMDVTGVKRAGLPWDHPDSDPKADMQAYIDADRLRTRSLGPPPPALHPDLEHERRNEETRKILSDRDLMSEGERELWEDIEGGPPKHGTIAYPPPAEGDTQQWITDQLQERTGGITRHPFDKTQYPVAPNAADNAARDYVNERLGSMPSARAYFTHGYSMQRLTELKRMAERRDPSLTTEEIQALRVRGIA